MASTKVRLETDGPVAMVYFGAGVIVAMLAAGWALAGIVGIWIAAFLATSTTYYLVGAAVGLGEFVFAAIFLRRYVQYRRIAREFKAQTGSA